MPLHNGRLPRAVILAILLLTVPAGCGGGALSVYQEREPGAAGPKASASYFTELIITPADDVPFTGAVVTDKKEYSFSDYSGPFLDEPPAVDSDLAGRLYALEKNGRWGVIDGGGKIVINPAHERLAVIGSDTQLIYIERTSKNVTRGELYDIAMNRLLPGCESVFPLGDGRGGWSSELVGFRDKGLAGVITPTGKVVAPAEYTSLRGLLPAYTLLTSDLFYIETTGQNGLRGLVTDAGELVPPVFSSIESVFYDPRDFTRLLYIVGSTPEGGRGIYEGASLAFALAPGENVWQYEDVLVLRGPASIKILNRYISVEAEVEAAGTDGLYPLAPGLFAVTCASKTMLMDTAGRVILPFESWTLEWRGGFVWARNDHSAELYEPGGAFVRRETWVPMPVHYGEYCVVHISESLCGLERGGAFVLEPVYESISSCAGGWAISQNGKKGLFGPDFNTLIPPVLDELYEFSPGVLVAAAGGAYRLYALRGNELYAMTREPYERILPGALGVAAVCRGGKWGFVDSAGHVLTSFIYDGACAFNSGGFAAVLTGDRWGCVDASGAVVCPPTYTVHSDSGSVDMIGAYVYVRDGMFSRYSDRVYPDFELGFSFP